MSPLGRTSRMPNSGESKIHCHRRVLGFSKNSPVFPLTLTQREVLCSLLWKLEDNLKSET